MKTTAEILCKISRIIIPAVILLLISSHGHSENHELTPSDAFATIDLANRDADILINTKGIKEIKHLHKLETGLGPMHCYQMEIACTDTMILLEKKEGMRPVPRIVSSPTYYVPEDVKNLGEILVHEIQRVLLLYGIRDFPQQEEKFEGKIPTNVFGKAMEMFDKLRYLTGIEEITPSEVYPQLVRAASDVKSILTHIDPAQRYRIDAPQDIPPDIRPSHVFEVCLNIRRDINGLREHFNLPLIPVPDMPKGADLTPADVFIQIQIIIADLNVLKMGTGTISSTPLPIPVYDKTPADTFQQAVMVRYLLSQVRPLQNMVKKAEK